MARHRAGGGWVIETPVRLRARERLASKVAARRGGIENGDGKLGVSSRATARASPARLHASGDSRTRGRTVDRRMKFLPVLVLVCAATVASGQTAPSHKPGEEFRDCPDCVEMVVVPLGDFEMGANDQPLEAPP